MKIAQRLGCAPFVAVVKTIHLWNANDMPQFGRLHRPCFWRILVQSQMTAGVMVVLDKPCQMARQAGLIDNDHVVQAHSRRIVPMTRSTYARCQGEAGADKTCSIPITFNC